jgi:hypothetical protein
VILSNPDSTALSLFSLDANDSHQLNGLALLGSQALQLHVVSAAALFFG